MKLTFQVLGLHKNKINIINFSWFYPKYGFYIFIYFPDTRSVIIITAMSATTT